MKVIIIGNGIAGQTVAEQIRKKDEEVFIDIYTRERIPYYSRIFLPKYLVGRKSEKDLIVHPDDWYVKKKINLHLNTKIISIDPDKKFIVDDKGNKIAYDKLVLATGSNARRFDFGNERLSCLFTLRSIDDADAIRKFIDDNDVRRIFIIGGGLLGIELGFHLAELKKFKIMICEVAPHLLPRQLDEESANRLREYLESKGLEFVFGKQIDSIAEKAKGDNGGLIAEIRFKDGSVFEADMILEQIGIVPEISLAKQAGLKTDRGILVDEFMQTSNFEIYAVGDCAEFKGRIWGIIPAAREQGKIAASNIIGERIQYSETIMNTNLKIAGISLKCLGIPPKYEDGTKTADGVEIIKYEDPSKNVFRKALVKRGILKGAVLLGKAKDTPLRKLIEHEVDPEEIQEILKRL